MEIITGIAASEGYAIGRLYIHLEREEIVVPKKRKIRTGKSIVFCRRASGPVQNWVCCTIERWPGWESITPVFLRFT